MPLRPTAVPAPPARLPVDAATGPAVARAERATIASGLRLACMRISRRVRFESSSVVAPHQFSVLCRLSDRPHTPRELASIEKVSAPTMTRTVAGLVAAGWVERADDPADGRQVIVSLTSAGAKLVRETRQAREGWVATRLAGCTDEELDVLQRATELLERIAAE